MSQFRTCQRCQKKTKSYTGYCGACYPKVVAQAGRKEAYETQHAPQPKDRPFDTVDLFMICTDDYIGLTAKKIAWMYDRDEKAVRQQIDQCKADGRYQAFLERWRLKPAYDLYLESHDLQKRR